jgi:hypothetical protein
MTTIFKQYALISKKPKIKQGYFVIYVISPSKEYYWLADWDGKKFEEITKISELVGKQPTFWLEKVVEVEQLDLEEEATALLNGDTLL